MLSPFFQPRYSTVLYEKKSITCFQLSPDVQQAITTPCILLGKWEFLDYCVTVQCHKNVNLRFFSALNFILLNLMYQALTCSIKQLRGKNALLQNQTRSTLSYSVFATTKPGVVCLRRLQGVERRGNSCPPVAYVSDLIDVSSHAFQLVEKWSPGKNNNYREQSRQTHTKHRQKTRSTSNEPPMAQRFPQKTK